MNKFMEIISNIFQIETSEIRDELKYQEIQYWDSINHLEMVSEIEEAYDIEFEMDEIIAMESIGKIKEILKNHGVDVNELC